MLRANAHANLESTYCPILGRADGAILIRRDHTRLPIPERGGLAARRDISARPDVQYDGSIYLPTFYFQEGKSPKFQLVGEACQPLLPVVFSNPAGANCCKVD